MNTKEKKATTVRCERRQTEDAEYEYILSVRVSDMMASFGLPLYSISAAMTTVDGGRSESRLEDVFLSSKAATAFFDKIVENLATPIDLPFVFEDEMGG
jgi:hypothetical protein